jgi:hypothetical protein
MLADPSKGILFKALKAAGIENAKPISSLDSYKDASVFDVGVEFTGWSQKSKIEAVIKQEIQKLITTHISAQQLQASYAQYMLSFLKSIEDIGIKRDSQRT